MTVSAAGVSSGVDSVLDRVPGFNLVDEPWIPVLADGRRSVMPLRDALLRASGVDRLAPEIPTHTPALLRQVLLPVVLDALGAPKSERDWQERFIAGEFSRQETEKLGEYLDKYHSRFDLLDQAAPFAQVSGLRTDKGETKSAALLVPAVATGNNVPLFSVVSEGDEMALPPADAALWLLHTHCWDTAAIKTGVVGDPAAKAGKTTGNPVGPLGQLGVVMPLGRTLFETLMLNMPIVRGKDQRLGTPQWRADPWGPMWGKNKHPTGLLEVLTWQARRIRLFPTLSDAGIHVSRVLVAAGDRLGMVPEYEPHTVWRVATKPKADQPPLVPQRHRAGRAAWRGLASLLALDQSTQDAGGLQTSRLLRQIAELQAERYLPLDYPLRVQTFGLVYGTQSAVVEDAIFDEVPLPVAAFAAAGDGLVRDLVLDVARQTDELSQALNVLSGDVRRAVGGEPIPWDKGQRPGELFIHAMDPWVRRMLTGLQSASLDEETIERGRLAWETVAHREVRRIAQTVLDSASPQAFAGREDENARVYRESTATAYFNHRVAAVLERFTHDNRRQDRGE